jgi:hypothetical protein
VNIKVSKDNINQREGKRGSLDIQNHYHWSCTQQQTKCAKAPTGQSALKIAFQSILYSIQIREGVKIDISTCFTPRTMDFCPYQITWYTPSLSLMYSKLLNQYLSIIDTMKDGVMHFEHSILGSIEFSKLGRKSAN